MPECNPSDNTKRYNVSDHIVHIQPGERGFGYFQWKVLNRNLDSPIHYAIKYQDAFRYALRCIADWEKKDLLDKIEKAANALKEIVVVEGEDRGVILKSWDSPTHYDYELKAHVYDKECFSDLGKALCELYDMLEA